MLSEAINRDRDSHDSYRFLQEIGAGYYQLRGELPALQLCGATILDVKSHMTFIRLKSGNFLVVDTVSISSEALSEVNHLTNNGSLIEACIATHPFHTLFFKPFHELFPSVKLIGTPRHIRNWTQLPWDEKTINDPYWLSRWEADGVYMRIPEGAEFINPPENNHFSCVFVYNQPSRTIHCDDTIMIYTKETLGCCFSCLLGIKEKSMQFHPSMKKRQGLDKTKQAPMLFRAWLEKLIEDWDFDSICSAHLENQIGGAKEALRRALEAAKPVLADLAAIPDPNAK